jgi:hypothetical protein
MSAVEHPFFEQAWPEGEYRMFQIGVVVDDIIGACGEWARVFGIGPFHVFPRIETACWYRGDDTAVDLQIAVAQAGPVQIELIQQHCDRPSIFREWSRGGDAAFHQLATVTSEYDSRKAHLEGLGYEVVGESLSGPFRVAYVDTVDDFGFYVEVVERTEKFVAQVAHISQTCATWDGTDPVRLLTRDGYRVP